MNYFELLEYNGIKYSIENNLATVVGVATLDMCDIKIPEVIFGNVKVVSIADKAFARQSQITSVSLPESVDFIGKNAFSWCPSLKSIKMHGVKIIDERAFIGDSQLSTIEFSDKLTEIGDKAFAYCNSISAIEFPESLEYVGCGLFEGCRYLRYVSLPEKIDVIPNSAFYACTSLCAIDTSSNLRYIDEYAFAYCISLKDLSLGEKTVINHDAFFECVGSHNKTLVS